MDTPENLETDTESQGNELIGPLIPVNRKRTDYPQNWQPFKGIRRRLREILYEIEPSFVTKVKSSVASVSLLRLSSSYLTSDSPADAAIKLKVTTPNQTEETKDGFTFIVIITAEETHQ